MHDELSRHYLPAWLTGLNGVEVDVPITNVLDVSGFYPASHLDEVPVQYFGDFYLQEAER